MHKILVKRKRKLGLRNRENSWFYLRVEVENKDNLKTMWGVGKDKVSGKVSETREDKTPCRLGKA